ncbi:MAG: 5-formyltetrahydrofolate cyclo-ligase [Alkalispirochaetaceae bacterium]
MAKQRDAKQLVRDEVRRKVGQMESGTRLSRSEEVCARIIASRAWAEAQAIFAFVSLPDEIETTRLCEAALEQGKLLALPRFGEEGLVFFAVEDLGVLRDDNSMAIHQPPRDLPVVASSGEPRAPGKLLIVTPGRAFTLEGDRLGRGGGFYDRFFSALRGEQIPFQAIGVAFALQIYPELPVEAWDERVDGVVTDGDTRGLV